MGKGRLEAFSDGVIAIIITIMVLELRAPHDATFEALASLWPSFLTYVLSFVYVGIYWNNHHHLLHTAQRVSGGILWANLNLLFWLSLFPFATGWMGENHFAPLPSAFYGIVLLMAAIAYYVLQQRIAAHADNRALLRRALGADWKGKLSPFAYTAAIGLSFVNHWIAQAIYVGIALVWLVPDARIERTIEHDREANEVR